MDIPAKYWVDAKGVHWAQESAKDMRRSLQRSVLWLTGKAGTIVMTWRPRGSKKKWLFKVKLYPDFQVAATGLSQHMVRKISDAVAELAYTLSRNDAGEAYFWLVQIASTKDGRDRFREFCKRRHFDSFRTNAVDWESLTNAPPWICYVGRVS